MQINSTCSGICSYSTAIFGKLRGILFLDSGGLTEATFCCWTCEGGRTLNSGSGGLWMNKYCACMYVCVMEEGQRLDSFTHWHAQSYRGTTEHDSHLCTALWQRSHSTCMLWPIQWFYACTRLWGYNELTSYQLQWNFSQLIYNSTHTV